MTSPSLNSRPPDLSKELFHVSPETKQSVQKTVNARLEALVTYLIYLNLKPEHPLRVRVLEKMSEIYKQTVNLRNIRRSGVSISPLLDDVLNPETGVSGPGRPLRTVEEDRVIEAIKRQSVKEMKQLLIAGYTEKSKLEELLSSLRNLIINTELLVFLAGGVFHSKYSLIEDLPSIGLTLPYKGDWQGHCFSDNKDSIGATFAHAIVVCFDEKTNEFFAAYRFAEGCNPEQKTKEWQIITGGELFDAEDLLLFKEVYVPKSPNF